MDPDHQTVLECGIHQNIKKVTHKQEPKVKSDIKLHKKLEIKTGQY